MMPLAPSGLIFKYSASLSFPVITENNITVIILIIAHALIIAHPLLLGEKIGHFWPKMTKHAASNNRPPPRHPDIGDCRRRNLKSPGNAYLKHGVTHAYLH